MTDTVALTQLTEEQSLHQSAQDELKLTEQLTENNLASDANSESLNNEGQTQSIATTQGEGQSELLESASQEQSESDCQNQADAQNQSESYEQTAVLESSSKDSSEQLEHGLLSEQDSPSEQISQSEQASKPEQTSQSEQNASEDLTQPEISEQSSQDEPTGLASSSHENQTEPNGGAENNAPTEIESHSETSSEQTQTNKMSSDLPFDQAILSPQNEESIALLNEQNATKEEANTEENQNDVAGDRGALLFDLDVDQEATVSSLSQDSENALASDPAQITEPSGESSVEPVSLEQETSTNSANQDSSLDGDSKENPVASSLLDCPPLDTFPESILTAQTEQDIVAAAEDTTSEQANPETATTESQDVVQGDRGALLFDLGPEDAVAQVASESQAKATEQTQTVSQEQDKTVAQSDSPPQAETSNVVEQVQVEAQQNVSEQEYSQESGQEQSVDSPLVQTPIALPVVENSEVVQAPLVSAENAPTTQSLVESAQNQPNFSQNMGQEDATASNAEQCYESYQNLNQSQVTQEQSAVTATSTTATTSDTSANATADSVASVATPYATQESVNLNPEQNFGTSLTVVNGQEVDSIVPNHVALEDKSETDLLAESVVSTGALQSPVQPQVQGDGVTFVEQSVHAENMGSEIASPFVSPDGKAIMSHGQSTEPQYNAEQALANVTNANAAGQLPQSSAVIKTDGSSIHLASFQNMLDEINAQHAKEMQALQNQLSQLEMLLQHSLSEFNELKFNRSLNKDLSFAGLSSKSDIDQISEGSSASLNSSAMKNPHAEAIMSKEVSANISFNKSSAPVGEQQSAPAQGSMQGGIDAMQQNQNMPFPQGNQAYANGQGNYQQNFTQGNMNQGFQANQQGNAFNQSAQPNFVAFPTQDAQVSQGNGVYQFNQAQGNAVQGQQGQQMLPNQFGQSQQGNQAQVNVFQNPSAHQAQQGLQPQQILQGQQSQFAQFNQGFDQARQSVFGQNNQGGFNQELQSGQFNQANQGNQGSQFNAAFQGSSFAQSMQGAVNNQATMNSQVAMNSQAAPSSFQGNGFNNFAGNQSRQLSQQNQQNQPRFNQERGSYSNPNYQGNSNYNNSRYQNNNFGSNGGFENKGNGFGSRPYINPSFQGNGSNNRGYQNANNNSYRNNYNNGSSSRYNNNNSGYVNPSFKGPNNSNNRSYYNQGQGGYQQSNNFNGRSFNNSNAGGYNSQNAQFGSNQGGFNGNFNGNANNNGFANNNYSAQNAQFATQNRAYNNGNNGAGVGANALANANAWGGQQNQSQLNTLPQGARPQNNQQNANNQQGEQVNSFGNFNANASWQQRQNQGFSNNQGFIQGQTQFQQPSAQLNQNWNNNQGFNNQSQWGNQNNQGNAGNMGGNAGFGGNFAPNQQVHPRWESTVTPAQQSAPVSQNQGLNRNSYAGGGNNQRSNGNGLNSNDFTTQDYSGRSSNGNGFNNASSNQGGFSSSNQGYYNRFMSSSTLNTYNNSLAQDSRGANRGEVFYNNANYGQESYAHNAYNQGNLGGNPHIFRGQIFIQTAPLPYLPAIKQRLISLGWQIVEFDPNRIYGPNDIILQSDARRGPVTPSACLMTQNNYDQVVAFLKNICG